MLSQEDIDNQLTLLASHRQTLAVYLGQQAKLGTAYTPPGVVNGIREARDNIQRIKAFLRDNNVIIADHPNDDAQTSPVEVQSTPLTHSRKRSFFWALLSLSLVTVAFIAITVFVPRMPTPVSSPFLDTAGDPVSSIILEDGKDYLVTISGTWSTWEAAWWSAVCKGTPEPLPQKPSPDRVNGNVGLDAAFIFARPKRSDYCGQIETLPALLSPYIQLVVSLDNGTSWQTLVPDNPTYNPAHVYTYTLKGKGFPAQFKIREESPQDNYGVLTIEVKIMTTTDPTNLTLLTSGVIVSTTITFSSTVIPSTSATLSPAPIAAATLSPPKLTPTDVPTMIGSQPLSTTSQMIAIVTPRSNGVVSQISTESLRFIMYCPSCNKEDFTKRGFRLIDGGIVVPFSNIRMIELGEREERRNDINIGMKITIVLLNGKTIMDRVDTRDRLNGSSDIGMLDLEMYQIKRIDFQ